MDQQYCADITSIARSLREIAECMKAAEERARAQEATTPQEIEALAPAIKAVRQGMADLEAAQKQEFREQSIDVLDLSVRAYNVLRREGVHTLGDMLDRYETEGVEGFAEMRNLGDKGQIEVLGHVHRLKGGSDASPG